MEQYYVFLKDNRVTNIALFATQDEELAARIAQEQGFDDTVWVGADKPGMWSTYDGTTFTPPTDEYLISIGIMTPPIEPEPEVTE